VSDGWDWRDPQPSKLETVWTLTKDGRSVTCDLYAHALGCELHMRVEGDERLAQAYHERAAALVHATDLRLGLMQRGWRAAGKMALVKPTGSVASDYPA
jgi:hypothetical protein